MKGEGCFPREVSHSLHSSLPSRRHIEPVRWQGPSCVFRAPEECVIFNFYVFKIINNCCSGNLPKQTK